MKLEIGYILIVGKHHGCGGYFAHVCHENSIELDVGWVNSGHGWYIDDAIKEALLIHQRQILQSQYTSEQFQI